MPRRRISMSEQWLLANGQVQGGPRAPISLGRADALCVSLQGRVERNSMAMARQIQDGHAQIGVAAADRSEPSDLARDGGAGPKATRLELAAGSAAPERGVRRPLPRRRRRWRSSWRSRPPIPTACSGTGWATSTSCSSTMPWWRREALGIVLTKRGKHLGQDIPMCGVPVHRADEYLQRLIKPATASPSASSSKTRPKPGSAAPKAVVKRDVVRLVTPGTLTEDTLLDAKARNYLTALFRAPERHRRMPASRRTRVVALASLDISTGEFEIGEMRGRRSGGRAGAARAGRGHRVAMRCSADADLMRWIELAGAAATPVPAASFDSLAGERDPEGPARRRRARRLRQHSRAPSWPRSARCCDTST